MTRLVMQIQSHDDVRPIVNAVAQWMPQARIQKGETPLTLLEFPKIEADSPWKSDWILKSPRFSCKHEQRVHRSFEVESGWRTI